MNKKTELIAAVKAARALLEDAGFKYTWVVGVENVDEDPENESFTLNRYTWDRYMPNVALLAIAADMLRSVHKKTRMSLDDMLMIILKRIADDNDDGCIKG